MRITDGKAPRSCFLLAISRQFPHNLGAMGAGGVIIRQLGPLKVGNDFPAIVQVEEIARHDEPRYASGCNRLTVFGPSEIEHYLRNHHTSVPRETAYSRG